MSKQKLIEAIRRELSIIFENDSKMVGQMSEADIPKRGGPHWV